jgi:hypothetical protein
LSYILLFLSFIIRFIVIPDVMSTIESNTLTRNSKRQSNIMNSTVPPPPAPLTSTISLPISPTPFNDDKPIEKFYKKEKQILLEFDQIFKGTCYLSSHLLLLRV